MLKFSFFALLMSATICIQSANACTEILLNKSKGLVISGRTLDYDCEMGSKICFREKGSKICDPGVQYTTLGANPLSWTSKYNAVFVNAFNEPAFVDGMNTEGLSAATLWHTDTETANKVDSGKHGISNISLVEYIVENAKDVEEAKKLLGDLSIFLSDYHGTKMTLHWIITDKSGKSVVVELKDGRPKFFDEVEKVGVMTNAPSYDKQLANLKSHEDAAASNPNYTLPGDYHSRSRFVKSAFLVSHLPAVSTADDGIAAATQILHNVESPPGAQKEGSYTQWMVVRDQSNLRYFVMGVKNTAPKMIDLKTFDFKNSANKSIAVESPKSGNVASILETASLKTGNNASSN